jgi:hypothetical protein
MIGPIGNTLADLGMDDLSQDIDAALDDTNSELGARTLTKIDFDELEVALDL